MRKLKKRIEMDEIMNHEELINYKQNLRILNEIQLLINIETEHLMDCSGAREIEIERKLVILRGELSKVKSNNDQIYQMARNRYKGI